jgi:glucose-1-phosphate cytidylyltransferase
VKVVILCGGLGTRLREETEFRPKPMVPIGERPILWHIMKIYAHHGFKEFVLCLGHKGEFIKEYFRNYQWNTSDVTLRLGAQPKIKYHNQHAEEDWTVTLVDTGQTTQTGGRVKRILPHIGTEPFLLTYGDGVTDSNISDTVAFHLKHKPMLTVTAVKPPGRFGNLLLDRETVTGFDEKPAEETHYINGGFFVVDPGIGTYLSGDECVFEREPMNQLAKEGKIKAYRHSGYWQCMDTYREQQLLAGLWNSGRAPWKVW